MALTDVSITGTTSVTSTGYGKMHICSGTTSNYAVTLPTAVSAPAGTLLGFRMDAALTKLVSLNSSTGTQIDGAASRIMWAGESAIMESDGAQWRKIAGKTIPMAGAMLLNSAQAAATATTTVVSMDTSVVDNTGQMVDTVAHKIFCRRPGTYLQTATAVWNTFGTATRCLSIAFRNGGGLCNTEQPIATGSSFPAITATSLQVDWAYNDYAQLAVYQDSGSSQNLYNAATLALGAAHLELTEIPSW